MPCCAAINCSNRSEKGFRLFTFPANSKRKSIWIQNMRRNNWKPSPFSQLCEVHFENSQFESKRADGWKKLKPNAVPTLFNVPNPPPRIEPLPRRSTYKKNNSDSTPKDVQLVKMIPFQLQTMVEQASIPTISNNVDIIESDPKSIFKKKDTNILLEEQIDKLQKENEDLRNQLQQAKATCYVICYPCL